MANLIHLNSYRADSPRKILIDYYCKVIECKATANDSEEDKVGYLVAVAELFRHKKNMGYNEEETRRISICYPSASKAKTTLLTR